MKDKQIKKRLDHDILRLVFLLSILIFGFTSMVFGQSVKRASTGNSKTDQKLFSLTKEISEASMRNDRTVLERLIADDFILTTASGKIFDKTGVIALWAEPDANVTDESYTISDPKAYIYKDTAIVIAIITDKWRDKDGEQIYRERIFDVWKKSKGKWRLIASKPTKM